MLSAQHKVVIIGVLEILHTKKLHWCFKFHGQCLVLLYHTKMWAVSDGHVYKLPPSSGKRDFRNSGEQFRTRSGQLDAPVVVTLPNRRGSHLLPNPPALRRTSKLEVHRGRQTRNECELTAFRNGDFLTAWGRALPGTADVRPHIPCLADFCSPVHRHILQHSL